ncbi:MAG TPA: FAD-dependent oxidoreductase [Cellvibrio sp.]|nr:FAD-dependent oxidoreductase [Cellvibrio sp.]
MNCLAKACLIFLALALTLSKAIAQDTSVAASDCKIVIVGGGPAGLYSAFRLGEKYGAQVCLFEKELRLGGRLYDVARDPAGNGPYMAVGGRRIMEGQTLLFNLAKELNISLDNPTVEAELTQVEGKTVTHKNDLLPLYPKLVGPFGEDAETQLLTQLLTSSERKNIDSYRNFSAYAKKVIGAEGFRYLHDMSRFRADFEYPINARSYVDYLEEEINVCCKIYYPVGGMTAFIRAMESRARSWGVQIFIGEGVQRIDKQNTDYTIVTAQRSVQASRLIIAVPPLALQKISGSIAEKIKSQPQFKAMMAVKVTTVAQWYDQPWWKDIRTAEGRLIWRGTTTDHCINSVEIPQETYTAQQNAIRAVYNDKLACAERWKKLAAKGNDALEAEIHKGLTHLLIDNGITQSVNIPVRASKTVYHLWEDGWYFQRAESQFSNQEIADWALSPLPGEQVGLASEGYNPQRSGWSDGAYKSAIRLLNAQYAMNL